MSTDVARMDNGQGTGDCPMSSHYSRVVLRDGRWVAERHATCQISHVTGANLTEPDTEPWHHPACLWPIDPCTCHRYGGKP